MKKLLLIFLVFTYTFQIHAQDYFLGSYGPYDPTIESPESFLGYPIGSHHTRHDRIVSYMEYLAEQSPKATILTYGETYEHRTLIMLTVSSEANMADIDRIQRRHLNINSPEINEDFSSLPVFVNLGYNVHGNEPSSSEAAMLTAYLLVASHSAAIENYLENGVYFIDPVINPDGRDRHSHWANMYKGDPLVSDPDDVEHNEAWPRGRTNHYWFDLNRDWWLAVHPESQGKLKWYHQWYPNVVTDFHEMGSQSTYFFEPMKANASKDPVMPRENYTTLNETFARYFAEDLDAIGSLYFTKEVFDGTYPGYGSSYPDLQGGLGLLFEQASSRGHVQKTDMGEITFPFTIRNQLISSLATVRAAVENKDLLHRYQHDFFSSALENAKSSRISGYVFGDDKDHNRTKAFIRTLLLHQVKIHRLENDITHNGREFRSRFSYVVPTFQPQYRMIQNAFETYDEYVDSVFYDASAWSLVNFYNMSYAPIVGSLSLGNEISNNDLAIDLEDLPKSDYAYLIPWDDYYAPALLYHLLQKEINVASAFKPFEAKVSGVQKTFNYGTLMIPVKKQSIHADSLHEVIDAITSKLGVQGYAINTGYSLSGIDLGSRHFRTMKKPIPLMLIGDGISSYEAGEVWHALDTKLKMPLTKIDVHDFNQIKWNKYNVLVLVSGSYSSLDSSAIQKIKSWINEGNTLITTRQASEWAIKKNLVAEKLIEEKKDEENKKKEYRAYVNFPEELGRESVGGAIFKVQLDLTHPLAFGYHHEEIPVYRNSTVWLAPSENAYSTVARYPEDPHIDGFITEKNLNEFLKPSASMVVSKVGGGRAILFAENPNFRGSWYGTNKLFFNALFFGNHLRIPG